MESGAVVEGLDVVKDGGASFRAGGEALMIDNLIFEGAPERLDEGVIVAVAGATHGSDQTVLGQELAISGFWSQAHCRLNQGNPRLTPILCCHLVNA